jgi:3-methylcrotonyl-CoA carboxylase alpha subunit
LSNVYDASVNDRPFEKVLIANRGEIACRVIRTCRQLQIPTVALYSVADGPHALHASMADEAYLIGTGPHPSESYLLQDQVLEIALKSGAQGIHPGYVRAIRLL